MILIAFLVSAASKYGSVTLLPSWAPSLPEARATLSTLWQAHTAIVGLSIPLLIVLLEQAKSLQVLATSAGEAMIARSWIALTAVLSLGSVVEVAVVSTYLPSDGALLVNLVLSCICVLLILRGYTQALHLLLSPKELRAASEALLLQRLEASIQESFVVSEANAHFAKELSEWAPGRITDSALRKGTWEVVLLAPHAGVVMDLDIGALKDLLKRFARPRAEFQTTESEPEGIYWTSERTELLFTPIGDRVHRDQPLLALRSANAATATSALLQAHRISA